MIIIEDLGMSIELNLKEKKCNIEGQAGIRHLVNVSKIMKKAL